MRERASDGIAWYESAMRTHLSRPSLLSLAVLAAIAGCTSVDSSDIKTHGINPGMHVTSSADAAGSHVDVTLHVGNSPTTFVNLADGDSLTASTGGDPVELKESNLLGVTSYSGDLDTQEPGTKVTIVFTRQSDESAPASTVTMTEKLSLSSPQPGAAFSRDADDLTVAWTSDPSDDGVTVSWTGDCVEAGSIDVAAGESQATIDKSTIKKRQGDNVADSCDVTIAATRTRTGTLDPAFGGGAITHSFSASAKVTANP